MAEEEKKEEQKKEEQTPKPEEMSDQQIFDQAFAEAVVEPLEKKPEEPIPGPKEEPAKPAEPSPEPKDTQPKPAEPIPAKSPEEDWKALYDKEVQKTKSWEGRISAANKAREEAEKKLKEKEAPTPAKEAILPDGDADKILAEFGEEYPTLVEPIKALASKIAGQIIADKLSKFEPAIAKVETLQKTIAESDNDKHFSAIREKHADYETIFNSGKLVDWVSKQPEILQPRYHEIIEHGNAKEVIGLFDAYKRGSNPTEPKPEPSAQPKPSEKARKLMAVPATPSIPPKDRQVDMNDFDTAFREALARG